MTEVTFGSSATTAFSLDSSTYIYTDGVSLPTGREMANGSTGCLLTALYANAWGRSGTISMSYKLGSAGTSSFSVGTGGTAGWKGCTPTLVDGGSGRFSVNHSGAMNFGRSTSGGTTKNAKTGYTWSGVVAGGYRYAQAPTAPTIGAASQASPVAASLSWSEPSDDGDSPVTGYRIQYATNAAFTGASTLDVGDITSRVVTGLLPGSRYWFKVAAINAVTSAASTVSVYSESTNVLLVADVGDLDGWEVYGSLPAGLTPLVGDGLRRGGLYPVPKQPVGLIREIQCTGTGSVVSEALGIRRTITGLKIGANYKITGSMVALTDSTPTGNTYAFTVTGKTTGTSATTSDTATVVAIPEYTFTATATTHVIGITLKEAASWSDSGWFENVGFFSIKLWEVPLASPYKLQDTVYEGSLANHFSYACDTVGAAWWVDRKNVTQFRQATSQDELKATFTDEREDGELEYVGLGVSFTTADVINIFEITNHGRDAVTGNADDAAYSESDPESITQWGARSSSVDMTLRSGSVIAQNLIPNPSAEVDLAGVIDNTSGAALSRSTAQHWVGDACFADTAGAGSTAGVWWGGPGEPTYIPVVAGEKYRFSVYVRNSVSRDVNPGFRWYSDPTTTVGSDDKASLITVGTTWTRISHTATAPAGANFVAPFVYGTTYSSGNILYADAAMLTLGEDLPDYFDGDTANTENDTYEWTGESHGSVSVRRDWTELRQRIAELLADNSTPEVAISSLRWNAQENPAAAHLDIQDRVRVRFQGITQDLRIIGIRHDISPNRWMTTLTLKKS